MRVHKNETLLGQFRILFCDVRKARFMWQKLEGKLKLLRSLLRFPLSWKKFLFHFLLIEVSQ